MEYIETDSPLRLGKIEGLGRLDALVPILEPGEGFQLECEGKVVGALISPRDLELYLQLLREYEDKLDLQSIDEAKEHGDWVPWEQLKAHLGS